MEEIVKYTVIALVAILSGTIIALNILAKKMKREGKSCEKCYYYDQADDGKEYCSTFGYEPIPFFRSCSGFYPQGEHYKRINDKTVHIRRRYLK